MSRGIGYWALGLVIGVLCALAIVVAGATALLLAIVAIGLALMRWPNLAVVSGACTGLGGTWIGLLVRAQLACDAFDAGTDQSCTAYGVVPFVVVGGGFLLCGMVVGGVAWWRRVSGDGVGGGAGRAQ